VPELAPLSRCLAPFVATAAVGLAQPAKAAETCQVELGGLEHAAWRTAAAELRATVDGGKGPNDCSAVFVHVTSDGASLTFTAADGRTTTRALEHPVELVATVQALSATAPERPPVEPAAKEPEPSPLLRPPAPKTDRSVVSRKADPPSPYAVSPLFGGHVGFRMGADDLVSPLAGVTGALLLDLWELGLVGRYEAHYVDNGGDNGGRPDSSGAALGLTAGRRVPAGSFGLRAGASMLIAALHEENAAKNGRAELRLGGYGGGVWPERAPVRLRLDLGFELVPYNLGRSEQNATGASSLPWWALTFATGAEFR
jgi:hypothetical protein